MENAVERVLLEFPQRSGGAGSAAPQPRDDSPLNLILALEWAGVDLLKASAALRARWLDGRTLEAKEIERARVALLEASGAIQAWETQK